MSQRRSTVNTVDVVVNDRGFAVVDVETTGFSPERDRIVEVAVVLLDPFGRQTRAFDTLVDPGRDPGPTHIHRITASMLEGSPSFTAIHPYLAQQLSGRVLVGHNLDQFDLPFLRSECVRTGGDMVVPGELVTVDTLVVAQVLLGLRGKARLVECCAHFGLRWGSHHTALGDALVTASLFTSMWSTLGGPVLDLPDLLDRASATAWPGGSDLDPVVSVRIPTLRRPSTTTTL